MFLRADIHKGFLLHVAETSESVLALSQRERERERERGRERERERGRPSCLLILHAGC